MTLVLTADLANTPLGEILANSTDPIVELHDESGHLVARILINQVSPTPEYQQLIQETEEELELIRHRLKSDRDASVTTQELLRRAEEAARD